MIVCLALLILGSPRPAFTRWEVLFSLLNSLFPLLSYLCDLCALPSVNGACPDPVGVLPSFFAFLLLLLLTFNFEL